MRIFLAICLAFLTSGVGSAQGTPITPLVTLGITLPVVGQPATIQVLVTNPTFNPVPTGEVTIDFGDDSGPITLPISTTRVETTRTYNTLGQFTITTSYSGDFNFAPATASLSTVSVRSSPVYTLRPFGDSLTQGGPGNWPALLTGALGWPSIIFACGGCPAKGFVAYIFHFVGGRTF